MDYSVLERSPLFTGIPAKELRDDLEAVPHHIRCYEKGETILLLMEEANRIGIILEGRAQAQKLFPNGSQVNVSVRIPGDMIGPAAVFSKSRRYPCDVVAIEPCTIMMSADYPRRMPASKELIIYLSHRSAVDHWQSIRCHHLPGAFCRAGIAEISDWFFQNPRCINNSIVHLM